MGLENPFVENILKLYAKMDYHNLLLTFGHNISTLCNFFCIFGHAYTNTFKISQNVLFPNTCIQFFSFICKTFSIFSMFDGNFYAFWVKNIVGEYKSQFLLGLELESKVFLWCH